MSMTYCGHNSLETKECLFMLFADEKKRSICNVTIIIAVTITIMCR